MTGVAAQVAVAVLFFAAGLVVRSDMAKTETGRWQSRVTRMRADRDRWRARATAESDGELRTRLGADAWLAGALEAACGELKPGERAEVLTVQARWKNAREEVLIGFTRGEAVPERVVRYLLADDDGEPRGWLYEDIDFPAPESPEWVTG